MSFEVYPVNPTRESDVVSPGYRWRFRDGNGDILLTSFRYFETQEEARERAEDAREGMLARGKRIAWRPIVFVDDE